MKYLPISGKIGEIPELRSLSHRILILCSSRTGSEYLSYLFEDFGVLVYEYLNIENFIANGVPPYDRASLRDYIVELVQSAPNGKLGIKGTSFQTLPLFLFGEWPKYASEWAFVHVRRHNIVGQAISLLIAEKSGAWNAASHPLKIVKMDEYDFDEISRCINNIVLVNNHIERMLSYMGVGFVTVHYEDLKAEPRATMDVVGRYVGLDRLGTEALEGRGTTRPAPRVQSTDINTEWEARFRNDLLSWRLADELGERLAYRSA